MSAVDPDGYPSHVASDELIESAWGNAVVDKLHLHGADNVNQANAIAGLTASTTSLQGQITANINATVFGVRGQQDTVNPGSWGTSSSATHPGGAGRYLLLASLPITMLGGITVPMSGECRFAINGTEVAQPRMPWSGPAVGGYAIPVVLVGLYDSGGASSLVVTAEASSLQQGFALSAGGFLVVSKLQP